MPESADDYFKKLKEFQSSKEWLDNLEKYNELKAKADAEREPLEHSNMTLRQMLEAEIQFRIENSCDFNITPEDFDEMGEAGVREALASIISGDELIGLYGQPMY